MRFRPTLSASSHPSRFGLKLLVAGLAVGFDVLVIELVCEAGNAFRPQPREEVGVRSNQERPNFIGDTDIGWRMRSNVTFTWESGAFRIVVRADDRGFRIDEHPTPAAPQSRRIAFIGDSFTFGTGVAFVETFASRCAQELGAVALNRAQPGFGIDQMWATCDRYVLPEHPDIIVVAFIVNDFDRSLTAYRETEGFNKPVFKLVHGELERKTAADCMDPVTRFLDRRSHLFALGRLVARNHGRFHGTGEWFDVNAACLEAMGRAARAEGIPLLIVHIPQRGAWRDFPALEARLRRGGIEYFDLASCFSTEPAVLYRPPHNHPTAPGHALIGAAIATEIRQRFPSVLARTER
jgi:hypothetical protein